MSTFTITEAKVNKTYNYVNEDLVVQGTFQLDQETGALQSLNGSCYRAVDGNAGDYVGNFTGYLRDDEIKYTMSEMSRKDSMLVWDAIDDIEANIKAGN